MTPYPPHISWLLFISSSSYHHRSTDRQALVLLGFLLFHWSTSARGRLLALFHPEVVGSQHPLLGSICSSEPLSLQRNWLDLSDLDQGGLQRESSRDAWTNAFLLSRRQCSNFAPSLDLQLAAFQILTFEPIHYFPDL